MKKQNLQTTLGTNDLFSYMTGAPWVGAADTPTDLNLLLLSKYGLAQSNRLVSLICSGDVLTSAEAERLATLIEARFHEQWKRLYATLGLEYQPLENYDRVEDIEEIRKNTGNQMTTIDSTVTTDYGKSEVETESGSEKVVSDTEEYRYGYDSSDASPVSKNHSEATTTPTDKKRVVSDSGADVSITAHTNDRTDNLTETMQHKNRTHGNIGVTTSQQMLESELDLWRRWNFWEQIVSDVGKSITLPYRG